MPSPLRPEVRYMRKPDREDFASFSSKSKLWAYLWWLLLGWVGVHKLYLRQYLEFVLYLGLTGFGIIHSFSNLHEVTAGNGAIIVMGCLLFVDIFRIPFSVKRANDKNEKKIAKRSAEKDRKHYEQVMREREERLANIPKVRDVRAFAQARREERLAQSKESFRQQELRREEERLREEEARNAKSTKREVRNAKKAEKARKPKTAPHDERMALELARLQRMANRSIQRQRDNED